MIAGSSSAIGCPGSAASGACARSAAQPLSISTTGTPGSTPPRRASRLRSAISSAGRQSPRPKRISSPVHQPFRPTAIAPRLTVAQKATIHSGQFAARIATRSPGPTPWRSRRAEATAATSRACAAKLVRRSPKEKYSASPKPAERSTSSRSDRARFANTRIGTPSTGCVASSNSPPGPSNWASTSCTVGMGPGATPRRSASAIPPASQRPSCTRRSGWNSSRPSLMSIALSTGFGMTSAAVARSSLVFSA